MHWENEGAFTGAVSPIMLKDAGCSHVILGHSERRQLFGETDDSVAKKAEAAFRHGLTPIVCVGETLAERESGRTMEIAQRQTERALRGLTGDQVSRLVLAYEPVWAIGTGRTATPELAQEAHAFVRAWLRDRFGPPAEVARILYGGSMKPDNAAALLSQPDIDGGLVGGASLDPADFSAIIRSREDRG
jgi:triosephosphate isomerase